MNLTPTVLVIVLSSLTTASVCPAGDAYWNASLERCVNCTRCELTNHVVLRPCEVHRDTVCGPLSDLDIDWAWLNKHHRRHHGKHHHQGLHRGQLEGPTPTQHEVTYTILKMFNLDLD